MHLKKCSFDDNSLSWSAVATTSYDLFDSLGTVFSLTAFTKALMFGRISRALVQTGTFSSHLWLTNFNGIRELPLAFT